MKNMNKSLLVALCIMTAVSAQAEGTASFGSRVAAQLHSAKDACANFASGVAHSTKNGVISVGESLASANNTVDSAITSKVGWFKDHNNTLNASKAIVATAVVATTCYMLKKAYDAVQAYRAKKA